MFFDDDIVTPLTKPSPKRATVPRSPKKIEKKAPKPKETSALRHQEAPPPPPPPVQSVSTPKASVSKVVPEPPETQTSPDRRLGQKIGMRLRNLLKLPKAHKWVCYEWFYSNIDK